MKINKWKFKQTDQLFQIRNYIFKNKCVNDKWNKTNHFQSCISNNLFSFFLFINNYFKNRIWKLVNPTKNCYLCQVIRGDSKTCKTQKEYVAWYVCRLVNQKIKKFSSKGSCFPQQHLPDFLKRVRVHCLIPKLPLKRSTNVTYAIFFAGQWQIWYACKLTLEEEIATLKKYIYCATQKLSWVGKKCLFWWHKYI